MKDRAVAAALTLLSGAIAVAGCAAERALTVQVSGTGEADAPCAVEVEGQRVAMRDFPGLARQWRGLEAHVGGDNQTPYRCIGAVVIALQRAGLRRIGFLSYPAPTDR